MKKGIDVSYANGVIDWSAAKKDIEFAIIRSSFGSDLPSQIDNYFYQNANGCVKNSIPFGTYHFAYFTSVESAKKEADFAIRLANEYKQYVRFIALDVEEDSVRYARAVGSIPNYTDCAIAFCERIKAAGYIPVIYTNQSWIESRYDWGRLTSYKLWYAAPGASAPKYKCSIWQYAWDGQISGSYFKTDMDCCYDDELFGFGGTTSTGTGTAEKQPTENQIIDQLNSSQVVNYDVIITSDNGVNIRAGAATSYKIIGAIPHNTKVHISRQTAGGGYKWGLTTYGGALGWIALNYTYRLPKKTIEGVANEVVRGSWGAGEERYKLLTEAGYDYDKVQQKVNEILGG